MEILKDYEGSDLQTYIRLEEVRSIEELEFRIKKINVIATNFRFGYRNMLSEIKSFENSRPRKDTSRGKPIYGMMIILLLPIGDWNTASLASLTTRYMRRVVGKETGLKYLSFVTQKGKAKYLNIYVYDREYLEEGFVKKYKRDFIIDKNTRKAVSKDHPEAIVLYKKGEVQRDVEGNEKRTSFKETKTRIFAHAEGKFEEWKAVFVDFYVSALKKFKVKVKDAFLIRRKNLKKAYNRFARRIIVANNQLIQYVQDQCNLYYAKSMKVPDAYDITKGGYEASELIPTKASYEIKDLLQKYRKIFADEAFVDKDIVYKLNGFRCDVVEGNVAKLREIFKIDLNVWRLKNDGIFSFLQEEE